VSGARPEVDGSKLGLFGYSMGGFLAVRAAAFEHRLAAVFAVDGLYSVFEPYYNTLTGQVRDLWDAGNYTAFDAEVNEYLGSGLAPTETVWSLRVCGVSMWRRSASSFARRRP
jgi:dipeptidyl aminopeptidase/acylaminoacyl peptidase